MTVLYEDEHLLVVTKSAGRLAQPDHTGDVDVLTLGKRHLSDAADSDDPFLGLVHRLDRPTSGLMVLARTSEAARHLSRQFRERTVQKQYLAVVAGRLRGIGTWTDFIAKPNRQPTIVAPDHPEGKRAELDWQALHTAGERTLLQLRLHTGRPHQIRLQAAERGVPVVGDTRYGGPAIDPNGKIALHHGVLRVDHPTDPRRRTFVADLPACWNAILEDETCAAATQMLDRATPTASSD